MDNEIAGSRIQTKVHELERILTQAKLLANSIEADVVALGETMNLSQTFTQHSIASIQKTQTQIGGAQAAVVSTHKILDASRAKLGLRVTASGAWKEDTATGHAEQEAISA
jgi:hypothetical protein